jgi:hypothetical protein
LFIAVVVEGTIPTPKRRPSTTVIPAEAGIQSIH